jgi:hypothetical protein
LLSGCQSAFDKPIRCAVFKGIAGGLFAIYLRTASPDVFHDEPSKFDRCSLCEAVFVFKRSCTTAQDSNLFCNVVDATLNDQQSFLSIIAGLISTGPCIPFICGTEERAQKNDILPHGTDRSSRLARGHTGRTPPRGEGRACHAGSARLCSVRSDNTVIIGIDGSRQMTWQCHEVTVDRQHDVALGSKKIA